MPPKPRQSAGRPLRLQGRGGKSGLHGSTVPDNVRRGRPQGKCHRKQTAPPALRLSMSPRSMTGRSAGGVRVKGCGKSAPRPRQRGRHGKPHREQNRIGVAGRSRPGPVSRSAIARAYRTRLTGRLTPFSPPLDWSPAGAPVPRPYGSLTFGASFSRCRTAAARVARSVDDHMIPCYPKSSRPQRHRQSRLAVAAEVAARPPVPEA